MSDSRNLAHLESGLEVFFKSSTSKVLAIKGPWGVGKTHYWNNYVSQLKNAPENLEQYSYVSLFGASSVRDIYNAIITKTSKPWEKKAGIASAVSWDRVKKLIPYLRGAEIPYLGGTQLLADFAIEKLIRKHLICFDDLERKGDLSADAFMGMIAELTEQKECKVVLIFNDQEIKDGTLSAAIASARDKLLDMELSFSPTVRENVRLIKTPLFEKFGFDCCDKLHVANLRIILRTEEILAHFKKRYAVNRPHFEETLLNRVGLLAVVHYIYAKEFSLSDFAKNDFSHSFLKKEDEELEPLARKCRDVSAEVGYLAAKWEAPIVQYLEGGVIDEELAKKLFDEAEALHVDQNINQIQSEIWQMYHSTFSKTQDEFISAHLAFLEKHCEDVAIYNVTPVVEVLLKMGVDAHLLGAFVDRALAAAAANSNDEEIRELERRGVRPELVAKIVSVREAGGPKETLGQLASRVGGDDGFNPPELALLTRFTAEEWVRWWRKETEKNTIKITKNLVQYSAQFKQYQGEQVLSVLNAALDRIRMESEIDRIRVDTFIRGAKRE